MTTGEKFVMIRNSMIEPVRFNVDVSYIESGDDQPPGEHKPQTGEGWGVKTEYFNGLIGTQVDHLSLLIGVFGIKASIRVHQIPK